MSKETLTRGLAAVRAELDAAAAGKWTGWRFVLLWAWIVVGLGLGLAYIAIGNGWLLTASSVILFTPLWVHILLSPRGRLRRRLRGRD